MSTELEGAVLALHSELGRSHAVQTRVPSAAVPRRYDNELRQDTAPGGAISMAVQASPVPRLEMAHVLFMDIVGYSKLPMDQQQSVLSHLEHAVRNTPHFVSAQSTDELICLPTGDGMALVFFGDAEAPVRCAVELAQALRYPEIHVRMGVHSGPVYRIADINANRNVSGGGINLAQRVMDCGDAGHILVSATVAEVLSQLSAWKNYLHDLGEAEVKHGVRVHLFNFYTAEVGNPKPPHAVHKAPTGRGGSAGSLWRGPVARWALAVVILGTVAGTVWRIRTVGEPAGRGAASPTTSSPVLPPAPGSSDKNASATSAIQQTPPATTARPSEGSPSTHAVSRPAAGTTVKADKQSLAVPPSTARHSQLAGHYSGRFSLTGGGESAVTIILEEQGGVVTGCLQTTSVGLGGGPIRGVANGAQVVASVLTKAGRTELQGQALGNQLRGSYRIFGKSAIKQGSFALERQTDAGQPAGFGLINCPAT